LSSKGFATGTVGNNDGGHVKSSQVRAPKTDDLGAQEVAKDLGGLPVVSDNALAPGSVKVVLANDYTGPGSGLSGGGTIMPARLSDQGATADANTPPPSPILTAGSDKPECIN
jgi:LytR cell envelope-related transcriptional attenuator